MASSCKPRRPRLPIVLSSICLAIYILTTVRCSADDSLAALSKPDISLIRISPEGDNVRRPSEIVLQFSAPVIPLGRMERTAQEIKIEIAPALTCQWRWTSTSAGPPPPIQTTPPSGEKRIAFIPKFVMTSSNRIGSIQAIKDSGRSTMYCTVQTFSSQAPILPRK